MIRIPRLAKGMNIVDLANRMSGLGQAPLRPSVSSGGMHPMAALQHPFMYGAGHTIVNSTGGAMPMSVLRRTGADDALAEYVRGCWFSVAVHELCRQVTPCWVNVQVFGAFRSSHAPGDATTSAASASVSRGKYLCVWVRRCRRWCSCWCWSLRAVHGRLWWVSRATSPAELWCRHVSTVGWLATASATAIRRASRHAITSARAGASSR